MSPAAPGPAAHIRLIYPRPEHEIYEDSTFLMGSVTSALPDALLMLDAGPHAAGKQVFSPVPIPLSPQGFFAYKIPIHAGLNPMSLTLRSNQASPPVAQSMFALHGAPVFSVLPALPLAVHPETLQPADDCWLSAQDALTVTCSASVGAEIVLDIPGFLKEPLRLEPVPVDVLFVDTREVIFAQLHWNSRRIPTQGYYRAQVPVVRLLQAAGLTVLTQDYPDLPLVLNLRHGEHSLKQSLKGRLSLLQAPRSARVIAEPAVSRTAPVDGARLTPQVKDIRVSVDALQQGWARVRLSPEEVFWLPESALSFSSASHSDEGQALAAVAHSVMNLVSIQTKALGPHASVVSLSFSPSQGAASLAFPVQVEVIPSAAMNRLQVRLYGVCSRCDFIQYPPDDATVSQVHWRPVAETVLELWIDLHQAISGYDYAWQDGQWQFSVKTLPSRLEDVRVLIDPGHGGPEPGSTGLNGLPEKDLNLTVSRLLRDALLQAGFHHVSLTRNRDEELALPARGQCVLDTQADLVLSIHHNALPDGRDPLQAEGACCFYYHPFAKSLAQQLLNGLTDHRGSRYTVPNYGLFYDSLYMTRIHQATAVLVEIGFFTNPTEFERLIDPKFQKEAVQRLASALRQACLQGRQG